MDEIYLLEKASLINYQRFYQLLNKICRIILNQLEDLKTERGDLEELEENNHITKVKRTIIIQAKNLLETVSQLQWYLKQLSLGTGREENIPVEFIFPLEPIIEHFIEENLIFLIASWERNYKIVDFSNVLSRIFKNDKVILDEINHFKDHIIIINLPCAWKEAALMHPLLFHEIGHLLINLNPQGYKENFIMSIDNKKIERILKRIRSDFSNKNSKVLKDLQYFINQSIFQVDIVTTSLNWYNEILCDFFGFSLMNLGFIFAFTSFFRTSASLTSCGPTHPPGFLRFGLLYYKLSKDKRILDFLKTISPDVYNLLKDSATRWEYYKSKLTYLNQACVEVLENYKEHLLDSNLHEMRGLSIEEFIYNHDRFIKYKDKLFELLLNFIPINEIIISETESYQCNLALIINVGWFFYYNKEFDLFKEKALEHKEKPESRYSGSLGPGISQIHRDKEIPKLHVAFDISNNEKFENNFYKERPSPFSFLNCIINKSIQLSFIQEYLKDIWERKQDVSTKN